MDGDWMRQIEAALGRLNNDADDLTKRVGALENFRAWILGAAGVIGVLIGGMIDALAKALGK